jgi:hypothetical protein
MASEIDISNLALSHLGDAANVSDFDEGSAQADHCRRFYPIARDTLLEMHAWSFATRRIVLAELSDPPDSMWSYAYSLPSNMVRALGVVPPDGDDKDTQDYVIETDDTGTKILFTNTAEAVLRYVVKITDTAQFSPLFTDALTWLLASYVAGPLIKGSEGIRAAREASAAFRAQFGAAAASDANQEQVKLNEMPSAVAARGATQTSPYLIDGRITR